MIMRKLNLNPGFIRLEKLKINKIVNLMNRLVQIYY